MGFRLEPRVRHIIFEEDTDFPGLELRVGGLTLDEWQNLKFPEAFDMFADRLIEWNVEDEHGRPVPTTREGVRSIDAGVAKALIFNWVDHATGVYRADPLGDSGTSGGPGSVPDPDMEAMIPMEPPVTVNAAG